MKNKINNIVRNYRIKELKGLNINPKLYYEVSDFLNEKVYCVFKEHATYIFLYETKNKAKKIDFEKTNSIIEKQFNINNNQSSDILDEWLREQKIISYLKLDIEKNKDYLLN